MLKTKQTLKLQNITINRGGEDSWGSSTDMLRVLSPGESQGRLSLVGCRLRGRTESDTTEAT